MGRRTILLIAALLVAALGTTLVFLYARGADARAADGQEMVQVLVAQNQVDQGTSGAQAEAAGAFVLRDVAKSSVATGALSDIQPVKDQVALAPIFPGQQVLLQQFGAPGSTSALPIPPGKMAVSVQLGDPERVAGFVTNGSDVAVFVTIQDPTKANANAQDVTQVLLPRVQVIGVGSTTVVTSTTTDQTTGDQNTEQLPKAILTLALSQQDASKLIYATQKGQLYFALLTDQSKVAAGGTVTAQSLFR